MEVNRRNIGVNFLPDGNAEIRLWSPLATSAKIIWVSHPLPGGASSRLGHRSSGEGGNEEGVSVQTAAMLQKSEYGYWTLTTDKLKPGDKYVFSIDNNEGHPDPASLAQLKGVHGPSTAIELNHQWNDHQWQNIALEEYIIYELHTGTFSKQNNFKGIESKLDHLIDLGINAIEIMPVGQFPGTRNWGYDGVFPFAVQDSYGGAKVLQELVNTCHQKGIAVILDVVYNHFGPEGNYLPQFGPYFTDKYHTPWGRALNFDDSWCNGARDYFIENALMWFRDFHIDALRLDAVHAIKDLSAHHLIKEIREHVDQLSNLTGKKYYLIAELDLNDPKYIDPYENGGYNCNAQWIDEFHHALRVSSGQPPEGYYSDFNGIGHLVKSYNDAYVYDGQFSEHRKKFFGAKTNNPGKQFIVFSQNHDQTGNRMLGERTSTLVSYEMLKLMAGAVLISPFLPMLFMGEEWGETNPFLFFISHTDKELAALVNKGRKEEFSYFNWQGDPPDPRLEETFNHSILQWNHSDIKKKAIMFRYYQTLIALRKSNPALKYPDRTKCRATGDENKKLVFVERWSDEQNILCIMNFSNQEQEITLQRGLANKLMDSASPEWLGPKNAISPFEKGGVSPEARQGISTKQILMQPESILIYEQQ